MMLGSIDDQGCVVVSKKVKVEPREDCGCGIDNTHLDSHLTLPPTSSKQEKGPDATWTR